MGKIIDEKASKAFLLNSLDMSIRINAVFPYRDNRSKTVQKLSVWGKQRKALSRQMSCL